MLTHFYTSVVIALLPLITVSINLEAKSGAQAHAHGGSRAIGHAITFSDEMLAELEANTSHEENFAQAFADVVTYAEYHDGHTMTQDSAAHMSQTEQEMAQESAG